MQHWVPQLIYIYKTGDCSSIYLKRKLLQNEYEAHLTLLEDYERHKTRVKSMENHYMALTLHDDHISGTRRKVFEEIKLEKDTGLDSLIHFMSKHLGKDDIPF